MAGRAAIDAEVGICGVEIALSFSTNSAFVRGLNGLGTMATFCEARVASVFSEGVFGLRAYFIMT